MNCPKCDAPIKATTSVYSTCGRCNAELWFDCIKICWREKETKEEPKDPYEIITEIDRDRNGKVIVTYPDNKIKEDK